MSTPSNSKSPAFAIGTPGLLSIDWLVRAYLARLWVVTETHLWEFACTRDMAKLMHNLAMGNAMGNAMGDKRKQMELELVTANLGRGRARRV